MLDRVAPKLVLVGSTVQRIRSGKIHVGVRCDEPCTVTGGAQVSIGRASSGLRSKKARRSLAAGTSVRLELRFSRKAMHSLARALALGKRVAAKVRVVEIDHAGNATPARRTIRLKF
jgi:hypothetical protein